MKRWKDAAKYCRREYGVQVDEGEGFLSVQSAASLSTERIGKTMRIGMNVLFAGLTSKKGNNHDKRRV